MRNTSCQTAAPYGLPNASRPRNKFRARSPFLVGQEMFCDHRQHAGGGHKTPGQCFAPTPWKCWY